jgi:hypothetical protein
VGRDAGHQEVGSGDEFRGCLGHGDQGDVEVGAQAVRYVAGDLAGISVHRFVDH